MGEVEARSDQTNLFCRRDQDLYGGNDHVGDGEDRGDREALDGHGDPVGCEVRGGHVEVVDVDSLDEVVEARKGYNVWRSLHGRQHWHQKSQ